MLGREVEGGGSCRCKGCLSEIVHVDQGASVGMRLIYPLPLVLHTQVQLLLSESDGDKLTGDVLVSTRLSNRMFPYSISTSPNHTTPYSHKYHVPGYFVCPP